MTLLLSLSCCMAGSSATRVLMDDIQSLSFHQGQLTTARRLKPVKQLRCVGIAGEGTEPRIGSITCLRIGPAGRYGQRQWDCQAKLPAGMVLGNTRLTCEGYDNRADPYVLTDSCAIEYSVVHRKIRERRSLQDSTQAAFARLGHLVLAFVAIYFLGAERKSHQPQPRRHTGQHNSYTGSGRASRFHNNKNGLMLDA